MNAHQIKAVALAIAADRLLSVQADDPALVADPRGFIPGERAQIAEQVHKLGAELLGKAQKLSQIIE
jgi:hypothetical protein